VSESLPNLLPDLDTLQRIIVTISKHVHVTGVHWLEFNSPDITVLTRDDFDWMVDQFKLSVGQPFGDYRRPRISATGMIAELHVTVTGPFSH
jgi:hypothetical protein